MHTGNLTAVKQSSGPLANSQRHTQLLQLSKYKVNTTQTQLESILNSNRVCFHHAIESDFQNQFFTWAQVQEPNKLAIGSVVDGPRLPTVRSGCHRCAGVTRSTHARDISVWYHFYSRSFLFSSQFKRNSTVVVYPSNGEALLYLILRGQAYWYSPWRHSLGIQMSARWREEKGWQDASRSRFIKR
jgi:hypothetical protein